MTRNTIALAVALCCGINASAADQQAFYQTTNPHDPGIVQVGYGCDCGEANCGCEFAEPACGCEGACNGGCAEPACGCEGPCNGGCAEPACGCEGSCNGGCAEPGCGCEGPCNGGCAEPACGCEGPCGCAADPGCGVDYCDGGCDSSCDRGCDCPVGGIFDCECCIGDPWTLFGEHCGWSAGGWLQLGYFNKANTLFNSRLQDELQVQQAWLYAEKAIDTSRGFGIGGRIDYLYGTDSQDTQAFGTNPRGWDNSWDNGPDYGHAIPQAYLEAGYGDLSVKVGHFYTIIGWEVVQATGNFFYSHAYTMYNSEPFTHTGALATYAMSDDVTIWGGYTMGWDSGFDDNGDAFLGGVSLGLTDDLTLIYASSGGIFGAGPLGTPEQGYMQSIVADLALTDNLQYIFQSDLLDSENPAGTTVRDTFGINQYLIRTVNDCIAYGARFEWYQNEGVYTNPGQTADIYELTLGLNYKPHANLIVRPEIRWDWVDNNTAVLAAGNTVTEDGDDRQTTFGVDTVITF